MNLPAGYTQSDSGENFNWRSEGGVSTFTHELSPKAPAHAVLIAKHLADRACKDESTLAHMYGRVNKLDDLTTEQITRLIKKLDRYAMDTFDRYSHEDATVLDDIREETANNNNGEGL